MQVEKIRSGGLGRKLSGCGETQGIRMGLMKPDAGQVWRANQTGKEKGNGMRPVLAVRGKKTKHKDQKRQHESLSLCTS